MRALALIVLAACSGSEPPPSETATRGIDAILASPRAADVDFACIEQNNAMRMLGVDTEIQPPSRSADDIAAELAENVPELDEEARREMAEQWARRQAAPESPRVSILRALEEAPEDVSPMNRDAILAQLAALGGCAHESASAREALSETLLESLPSRARACYVRAQAAQHHSLRCESGAEARVALSEDGKVVELESVRGSRAEDEAIRNRFEELMNEADE